MVVYLSAWQLAAESQDTHTPETETPLRVRHLSASYSRNDLATPHVLQQVFVPFCSQLLHHLFLQSTCTCAVGAQRLFAPLLGEVYAHGCMVFVWQMLWHDALPEVSMLPAGISKEVFTSGLLVSICSYQGCLYDIVFKLCMHRSARPRQSR